MLKLPSQFYAIERDGLHRIEIQDEFIGPQSDLLLSLSKFVPRVVQGIIPGVSVAVNQTGFALAKRIFEIALHTYYRPMVDTKERPVLVPVWIPPGAEIKCMWRPLPEMDLYFIQRWDIPEGKDPLGMEPLSYLIARHQETKRTYLLPLPNLYEDGRVCLGNNGLAQRTKSAVEVLEKGIEVLQKSTWNNDLLHQRDREAHALFRFDGDGNQVPAEKDWTEWCMPVNNSNYDFIAKIV